MLGREEKLHSRLRQWRNQLLNVKRGLHGVHATAYVHPSATVSRDIAAAGYVFIGPNCQLDPGVSIGRCTMLAAQVVVVGDDNMYDRPGVPMQFVGRHPQTQTSIGDDAWIGYDAFVRRGVTIGRGAIAAAKAVVTHDVPPYSIVAGTPAPVIGNRIESQDVDHHGRVLDGRLRPTPFATPVRMDSP